MHGKINHLPKLLRDNLSRRLEDGETGTDLVAWLNALPEVRQILADHFEGRPITEQNLSQWKQSGHLHWRRRQEAQETVLHLLEASDELRESQKDSPLSDRLALVLTAELARLATTLLEQETDPEKRWTRLCQIQRQLSELRHDDHRAVRTAIQREQFQRQKEREDRAAAERQKIAEKTELIKLAFAPMMNSATAEACGGGPEGERLAELLHRIKFDLPLDPMNPTPKPGEPSPASTLQRPQKPRKNAKIQDNPTQSN